MTKLIFLLPLLIIFYCHGLAAHSEHDKARFVAMQGRDNSNCDQVLRPCKTISYAVQQANKGDKILVSAGQYNITDSKELFYLASELVPVYGGYNRFDHFQQQSPQNNISSLMGVPVEMAARLRKKGFTVLSDGKSSRPNKALAQQLSAYYTLNERQVQVACEDGKAASFRCENIDLLAHMPLNAFSSKPSAANDIWGHVDLNDGSEYALLGLRNGISVINVTDPTNPVEVGTIPGQSSTWRDVKVYQYYDHNLKVWRAYAYATVDGVADFVTIIDLNHLPNTVSLAEKNIEVRNAHNVYISNVDHTLNIAQANTTPTLQLIGSNVSGGAFVNFSLEDPKTLTALTQQHSGLGYTHDGASLTITDDRKTNDCQNEGPNCTVFIDFNEKEIKLWDITDANSVSLLGNAQYDDVIKEFQYIHSGWGSEDQNYIFVHDEFDEKKAGINTTVRIFSIEDLNNPQQVGQWTGPTRSIDHNGFVRGNRYYMSTYERGLSVLDITDPVVPVEVGHFDTFTPSDNANFNGAWGAYPFLPSGNILVSDFGGGLYILKDNTLLSNQGSFAFTSAEIGAEQGTELSITIPRNAVAASATSVSVSYEIIPGSAIAGDDYTAVSGTLSWQASDDQAKTINIPIAPASSPDELQEMFFVRLFNPTQGATLNAPSYLTVKLDGKQNNGVVNFTQSELVVSENQNTFSVTLSRDGSSQGSISVNYHLLGASATLDQDVANQNGTLTWQDGEQEIKTLTIDLIDDELTEDTETFSIVLTTVAGSLIGDNNPLMVSISDDEVNLAPQVDLGEDFEVNTNQTVALTAQVSDNETDVLTYQWSQESGTVVTLDNPNQPNSSFIAPATSDTLVFTLTVSDNLGAVSSDSVTITVIAPVVAPPVVIPDRSPPSSSSGGSIGWPLLLLMLVWRRNRVY
jgi:choice-of-anchor B domain-containing protein